MWIAHFASGLIAKPFVPRVPLVVLALAGVLPDVAFFLLQFVGIETFNFDKSIVKHAGCFPYTNNYPYSHSLAGMAGVGVVLAILYKVFARVRASPKDMLAIVAVSASHFFLEWPSHRKDIKLTPHDSKWIGAALFDHPAATFITEDVIFLVGLFVYLTFTSAVSKQGITKRPILPKAIAVLMIAQQAHFCFGSAPTLETRWIHAPLFLFELLFDSWLIGLMDGQAGSVGLNGNAPEPVGMVTRSKAKAKAK